MGGLGGSNSRCNLIRRGCAQNPDAGEAVALTLANQAAFLGPSRPVAKKSATQKQESEHNPLARLSPWFPERSMLTTTSQARCTRNPGPLTVAPSTGPREMMAGAG